MGYIADTTGSMAIAFLIPLVCYGVIGGYALSNHPVPLSKEGSTAFPKPLSPQGRENVTALQCCICPTCPSPAGGSLTHSQALAFSKRARDVTALRCSEPLRFMVVGPSKVCAMLCGMGPPGERWIGLLKCWFCGNLLMSCRFLVIFLVVSQKMHNFAT